MITTPHLTTAEVRRRTIAYARQCVAAGLISERRLAALCRSSQPQVHHALSGKRQASPELADAIARALGATLLDLYTVHEVRALIDDSQAQQLARLHLGTEEQTA